ncbi:MAG: HAD family hydrolase [Clostridia bacterium]|nr:HAD family hydrolase [Clostridia bacterium]
MIRLCIFDMDGTIVNSLHSIAWFANETLRRHGFSPFPDEDYKQMVGNGAAKLMERLLERNGTTMDAHPAILPEYVRSYNDDPLYLAAPYDGVPEMLAALRLRGIRVAVLSNKPHPTTCAIADALFGDAVDACLGARDGVPLKPAPDGVFELLAQFGVSPAECLYIGDTGTDMKTAVRAGIFAVGVSWGFRSVEELEQNGADVVIHTPMALVDIADAKK